MCGRHLNGELIRGQCANRACSLPGHNQHRNTQRACHQERCLLRVARPGCVFVGDRHQDLPHNVSQHHHQLCILPGNPHWQGVDNHCGDGRRVCGQRSEDGHAQAAVQGRWQLDITLGRMQVHAWLRDAGTNMSRYSSSIIHLHSNQCPPRPYF